MIGFFWTKLHQSCVPPYEWELCDSEKGKLPFIEEESSGRPRLREGRPSSKTGWGGGERKRIGRQDSNLFPNYVNDDFCSWLKVYGNAAYQRCSQGIF